MKKITLLLILCCKIFWATAAIDTAKLNQLFGIFDSHQKVMTSVCLYRDGKVIYMKAIGDADVAKNKKANVNTFYRIGSISKMFTAVMILQLVDEKKLELDTRLSKFFPGIPNSQSITIDQMLSHRSGLFNFTSDKKFTEYMQQPQSEAAMIRRISDYKPDFEPGEKYSYSNTNYVLLSYILEKVGAASFSEQLKTRICDKAGLKDTRVGGRINTANNEALSYQWEKNKWVPASETDMSIPVGAGNIISTASDLCIFAGALFEGKLLSKYMFEKMKTLRDGYGFGLLRFPFGAKWFYGHTGGIDGFESMLGYNPEDKTAFCILGNGYNYTKNDIVIALLNAAYDLPVILPDFAPKPLDANQSAGIVGIYNNARINMKITLSYIDGRLIAQATGQDAFTLEKISELEYSYDQAGIAIQFVREEGGLIKSFRLKQGGMDLLFEKDR